MMFCCVLSMYREQRDIIERIFTREVCRLVLAMMRREQENIGEDRKKKELEQDVEVFQ